MRNVILFCICLFVLASCKTLAPPMPVKQSVHIDYSYLTNQGIFVTESNSVSFDYEACGSLYVECVGGWVTKKQAVDMQDIYIQKSGKYVYVPATIEDAFNLVLDELKALNGNGVINLRITPVSEYSALYNVNMNKIYITGMVIKM